MICSFCDTKMQISDREGIKIDYCPECGGIWLQRGALEGILARSSGKTPESRERLDSRQASDDDDDDGFPLATGRREQRGDREKQGGIREFLGSFFDFG